MSEERKDQVRPVEADGIKEFDNKLPRWWVWLFITTVVWGVIYLFYMEVMGGETLIQTFNKEQHENQVEQQANQQSAGEEGSQIDLVTAMASDDNKTEGKEVFTVNCIPCHGPDGGGVIGPNLTDKYWIHGAKPENIVAVITSGVPEKGMIAWAPILGQEKVIQVAAYVLSLQGSTPANPKAPEGNLQESSP